MGACLQSEFNREILEFMKVNQEVEVQVTKRLDGKLKKQRVKFNLKTPYNSISFTSNYDQFKCNITGVVLPGQDPHHVIPKDCQDNFFLLDNSTFFIIGLFDGHGNEGQKVVDFCIEYMKAYITLHITKIAEDPCSFINDIIISCDFKLREDSGINVSTSGTTAIVLIFTSTMIHIGSVGDSRAILASNSHDSTYLNTKSKSNPYKKIINSKRFLSCTPLTVDQKPDAEDERKRILESGGKIRQTTNILGQFIGPQRVWNKSGGLPGLAMSRSIGDNIAKNIGVISTPIIKSFQISPETDEFLAIASDGI